MAVQISDDKFVEEYLKLDQKPECTVRIFQKNEVHYCCLEDDASLASKILFNNENAVKNNLFTNHPDVGVLFFKQNDFESLVSQLILVKSYRVELWKNSIKTNGTIQLIAKGSPGNYEQFEDVVSTTKDFIRPNIIISLLSWQENNIMYIGLCIMDTSNWTLEVAEFVENDSLNILESVFLQKSPCECLIPNDSNFIYKNIEQICKKHCCFVTKVPKKNYDCLSFSILNDIITTESVTLLNKIILQQKNSLSCANSLIKYKEINNQLKTFRLIEYNPLEYMVLDRSSLFALSVFDEINNDFNKSKSSLYGMMNSCETNSGRRLLFQWLHQPLMNKSLINERLDAVETFVKNQHLSMTIKKDILKNLPDLNQLVRRLSTKKASLKECIRLYQSLLKIKNLITFMKKLDIGTFISFKHMIIEPLNDFYDEIDKYCMLIEKTVDFDTEPSLTPKVKSSIDPELMEIKTKIDQQYEMLQSEFQKVCHCLDSQNKKIIKLEVGVSGKYVMRVTLKDSNVLKSHKQFKILDSHANGIQFVNDEIQEISEELFKLNERYEIVQLKIVKNILQVTETYINLFNSINFIVSQIDVFISFASLCFLSSKPYTRPTIVDNGIRCLNLKEARHPLVERLIVDGYIENDINLTADGERFLVLTGPNMGGKSTYIRMVGLIQILCQIGSFVPCDEATISLVDRICTRIGSSDHFALGMSTFMTEMIDAANLLKLSTDNSLVIIDELGRGTSTYDGFGLACSIANTLLTTTKSFVLFATHFHEIPDVFFKHDLSRHVCNKHMEALVDSGNFLLTFRVLEGCCKKSFGINVARMAQLPANVIEDAHENLTKLEAIYEVKNDSKLDALQNEVVQFLRKNGHNFDSMSNDEIYNLFANSFLTT